ncbi:hypothetical protein EVAR_103306_1 [Eumeta japonica]|uniref:Uncharacterized protein n=1 Tax=Eumeta variegata TaxID=151549 RepID=A0A4C1XSA5_EUMVA|nr:hypothetical protein EVAR_103306_1 [Eumeta japonica]
MNIQPEKRIYIQCGFAIHADNVRGGRARPRQAHGCRAKWRRDICLRFTGNGYGYTRVVNHRYGTRFVLGHRYSIGCTVRPLPAGIHMTSKSARPGSVLFYEGVSLFILFVRQKRHGKKAGTAVILVCGDYWRTKSLTIDNIGWPAAARARGPPPGALIDPRSEPAPPVALPCIDTTHSLLGPISCIVMIHFDIPTSPCESVHIFRVTGIRHP